MENPIQKMIALGQSPWFDNIERRLLISGELKAMIDRGEIRGVTSNPSIFHNAIARSTDYDEELLRLAKEGLTTQEIYECLVVQDIQAAADLFLPLYHQTRGGDGFVSLEVNPLLAHDPDGTVSEVLRLWQRVNRPNLMIKIPATREGLSAIRSTIAAGVNVNVTLIFSLSRYAAVMEAYLSGLEDRLKMGQAIDHIVSVASFFISRLDTKADQRLNQIARADPAQASQAAALQGRLAIASARLAYQQFRKVFNSERYQQLKEKGARLQRPLWASTSTKNPAYPDTLYVDELIGPDTINTMPPHTLAAFMDHGKAELTIEDDLPQAEKVFADLESMGISIDELTRELEDEGVKAFADAYQALLQTLEEKRWRVLA